MSAGLPVILYLAGKRCVIVGGGSVAVRRAGSLIEAGALVGVIAPRLDGRLRGLGVTCHERAYQAGDLEDAALVVIATDDPSVNEAVAADARALGVLINRADAPQAGDLAIPAHARHGPVTVAVHTDGASASASARICRALSEALDPDWPRLIAFAAPFRALARQRLAEGGQRRAVLRQLTDDAALAILQQRGEQALIRHLQSLIDCPP